MAFTDRWKHTGSLLNTFARFRFPGGGGGLPYIKGGDARQEISNESLKGTNLGVA